MIWYRASQTKILSSSGASAVHNPWHLKAFLIFSINCTNQESPIRGMVIALPSPQLIPREWLIVIPAYELVAIGDRIAEVVRSNLAAAYQEPLDLR
jgi:hypothetical protein